ncbi:MAG: hypothetical protein GY754_10875 [bacterium]|nr:hypothetical protein [bacterium]
MFIVKFIILLGLWRLLDMTDQPFLCSGIYAGVVLIFSFFSGYGFFSAIGIALLAFVLSSIYFWLLNRFKDTGLLYWGILIVGLLIGLV